MLRSMSLLLRFSCLAFGMIAAPAVAIDSAPMPNVQIEERMVPSGLSVSLGAAYWEGKFGGATTSELFVAPLSVRWRSDNVRAWATLPYMSIQSDGVLFAGTDGGPILVSSSTPSPQGRNRDGLGDLTLGATWTAIDGGGTGLMLDLTTRVKLPTAADSTGLSTGKTDVSIAADVSVPAGGVVPYASVSYRFLGDPSGFDLRNTINTSVGVSLPFSEKAVALVAYEYDRAPSNLVDDGHEIFAAFSGPATDRLDWTAYGSVGLSEGASDFSAGLLLTLSL